MFLCFRLLFLRIPWAFFVLPGRIQDSHALRICWNDVWSQHEHSHAPNPLLVFDHPESSSSCNFGMWQNEERNNLQGQMPLHWHSDAMLIWEVMVVASLGLQSFSEPPFSEPPSSYHFVVSLEDHMNLLLYYLWITMTLFRLQFTTICCNSGMKEVITSLVKNPLLTAR